VSTALEAHATGNYPAASVENSLMENSLSVETKNKNAEKKTENNGFKPFSPLLL